MKSAATVKAQPPAKYASPDTQVDGRMSGGKAHSRRRHTAALLECREHVQLLISTQPRCWQSRKLLRWHVRISKQPGRTMPRWHQELERPGPEGPPQRP